MLYWNVLVKETENLANNNLNQMGISWQLSKKFRVRQSPYWLGIISEDIHSLCPALHSVGDMSPPTHMVLILQISSLHMTSSPSIRKD